MELIEELKAEAAKLYAVFLIVGFESTNVSIRADAADGMKLLGEAAQSGGEPSGLIGTVLDGTAMWLYNRVLAEHVDEPWAQEFMDKVTEAKAKTITDYITATKKEWLNWH
jgi:hypothetical protein